MPPTSNSAADDAAMTVLAQVLCGELVHDSVYRGCIRLAITQEGRAYLIPVRRRLPHVRTYLQHGFTVDGMGWEEDVCAFTCYVRLLPEQTVPHLGDTNRCVQWAKYLGELFMNRDPESFRPDNVEYQTAPSIKQLIESFG